MVPVLLFDVNETLLDLRALEPAFERAFGDKAARGEWFALLLRSALAATVMGYYQDFGAIGGAALEMVAARRGVTLTEAMREAILGGMARLPAHPEVPESLARLQAAGFRLAALTNSAQPMAEAQLRYANLADRFEQILSVDAVQRFKPAAEAYTMAARRLGVEAGGLCLVAAHDWDVWGAMQAGCRAAFVERPGMVLNPLAARPEIVGQTLSEVADQLIAKASGSTPPLASALP